MPALVFLVPGPIETRTGGYGYDRRIAEGLRGAGWDVRVAELDASFPQPTPAALAVAARTLAAIPDGSRVVIDGLALGAMPIVAEREQVRLRLMALVHHPLARETGLAAGRAAALEQSERRALACVRRVIVTSRATAAALADYGVRPPRVVVVEPGTDSAPVARGSGGPAVHLLCVASIVPRKGHEALVGALAGLPPHLPWRLTCVGGLDRDGAAVSRLRQSIEDRGLTGLVTLAGELEGAELDAAYDSADVFALATRYEGYGMAVAEAVARGLPVVSTATGAIPEIVGDAGLVVAPGDDEAFAGAMLRVVGDEAFRKRLRARAIDARGRLGSWDDASRRMAEVVSAEFQR